MACGYCGKKHINYTPSLVSERRVKGSSIGVKKSAKRLERERLAQLNKPVDGDSGPSNENNNEENK